MPRQESQAFPAGQRFSYWLGQAARRMRNEADVTAVEVALQLGQNTTKNVERFERSENRPQRLEPLLAAYGAAIDCDPRDIIQRAIELWFAEGEAPALPDLG